MLVLSRHRDEQIVIGTGLDQIVVTLVDIRGDKCRIGVAARPEIPVHRREVYDAIQRHSASLPKPPEPGPNCQAEVSC